jgi:hypothetical protein
VGELPELPEPAYYDFEPYGYTADQMQEYATLSLQEAERRIAAMLDATIESSDMIRDLTHDLEAAEANARRLPKEPPPGLLMSMAIRYDHALGLPGYYDQMAAVWWMGTTPSPSHAERLESTLRTMRQLYEEVAGHGFYSPEEEAEYAALAAEHRAQEGGA